MDARVQIIILSTEISKRKKKGTLNHAFCLKKKERNVIKSEPRMKKSTFLEEAGTLYQK